MNSKNNSPIPRLNWGILSTGRIAGTFAKSVLESKTGRLAAVGSRSREKAQDFARHHHIPKAYGSYWALLADPEMEAVYIATPHPSHADWAIRAAQAGKHILCEKPLTMNATEARRVIKAARENRVFLLEAIAYRCHPQTAKLLELVRRKVIGELRLIQGTFLFNAPFDPQSRIFNKKLGGGGILDIGCYAVSMARLVAGAAQGKPFADPVEVKGVGHIGRSGVDEWAAALLKFKGDIVAEVSCGVRMERKTVLQLHGSKGFITLSSPWACGWKAGKTEIILHKNGQAQKLEVQSDQGLYVYEADAVAKAVRKRKLESPAMTWADSLGNARVLDLWLKALRRFPLKGTVQSW